MPEGCHYLYCAGKCKLAWMLLCPEFPLTLCRVGLLQVCNKGLRDMLRGDAFKVERFKDELSELGNQFGQQGHKQGATFIYVLYKVAEHVLPVEHENLQVRPVLGSWCAAACLSCAGHEACQLSQLPCVAVQRSWLGPEHSHFSEQGTWASSFTKFFGVLEDSGWRIKRQGEEEEGEDDDIDAADALPDVEGGYFQQQMFS